ncbi:hypothetical protein, partial [Dietzia sp. SYD-A1]|uniref:hypothetical protein n=1 Tax=Dietzia sp. SYD-A1 TaxID=2780141 RepID=UPI0018919C75
MSLHLDPDAAEMCNRCCGVFIAEIRSLASVGRYGEFSSVEGAFDTARQIGAVYSVFVGEDLRTLLNGFIDQAKAMSMLFAAAGGLMALPESECIDPVVKLTGVD